MDEAAKLAGSTLGGYNYITCYPWRGAMTRSPEVPDAFSRREPRWSIGAFSFWDDAGGDEAHDAWGDGAVGAFRDAGLTTGAVYVNPVNRVTDERIRGFYGSSYDRLAQLKRKYDPDNVLHRNTNIPPAD